MILERYISRNGRSARSERAKERTCERSSPASRLGYSPCRDDEASFTAEGSEISEAEPDLAEVLVYTAKVTQLVRITNEQFNQTNTASQLSTSVARAINRRANTAFVAEAAPVLPAVAPSVRLVNVEGVLDGGTVAESLDALADLVALLEDNLAIPSQILVGPVGWGELREPKIGTTTTKPCSVQAHPTPSSGCWACRSSWILRCPTTGASWSTGAPW